VGEPMTASIDPAPPGGASPFAQCVAQPTPVLASRVIFTEGFNTMFKSRVAPLTNTPWASTVPNAGAPGQNIPGATYGNFLESSESGFIQPLVTYTSGQTTYTAGLADYGTRLKAVFTNIPSGASLYVSASNVSNYVVPGGTGTAPYAVLVATSQSHEADNDGDMLIPINGTAIGSDGLPAVPLTPDGSGTAAAIWEIVNSDPTVVDSVSFSVYLSYTGIPGVTGNGGHLTNVALNFAPEPGGGTFSLSQAVTVITAPVPRFEVPSSTQGSWATILPSSLNVGSSTVAFTYSIGGSAPANQTRSVTTTPGGQTVTVTTPGGWLSASLSGTTLTISANPSGLAASLTPYTSFIRLSTGCANDVIIPATLTVSALSITKTHTGNFTQGQSGAQYSIVVSNGLSAGPASGTITVTDTVPAGLTLVSLAGSGWTCPQAGTSCSRNDGLNAGASYSPITATVNVARDAPLQVTNQVTVSGGGSASTSASDTTNVNPALPMANSVSPASGSGASQAFTFVFSDPLGFSELTSAQIIINPVVSGLSSCYVWVDPAHNGVYLTNDGYNNWPGAALGSGGTLQNSQCIVNAAASSVAVSGNTLTVVLSLGFEAGYAGSKNVFAYATTAGGLNTGWQKLGTWNVTAGPQAVSVAPASGSGSGQTFSFVFSDPNGAADLTSAQVIINPAVAGSSSCYVWVDPAHNSVYLTNDQYNSWPGTALGSGGALQNSQCTVNAAASSVALSGNNLTVTLAVGFQPGYSGPKNVFAYATTSAGLNTGWQKVGIWTVTPGPQAVSVTPGAGNGSGQTFSFLFSDSNGATDLTSVQIIVNPAVAGVSSCYVWVDPMNKRVYLTDDTYSSWPGVALGGPGTLQNHQCTVNAAASGVALSGNNLTLTLALSFKPGYAGAANIYGYATTVGGLNSGWQKLGAWTVTTASQAVSVTPASGAGVSQTFTLVFADPNGAADLTSAQVIVNTSVSGVSSCYVWVDPVNRGVYLTNDGYTSWPGMALGAAGTLQNSQCAVNVAASSVALAGNNLTVTLSLSFKAGYTGGKNVYGYATTAGGLNSGWQNLGSYGVTTN
jgi:hypothetical protein